MLCVDRKNCPKASWRYYTSKTQKLQPKFYIKTLTNYYSCDNKYIVCTSKSKEEA